MANNPTLLKMPLATDGEKATIPETTGSTTGKFSQQYGFQAINALPLQAGGVAPKREDFNGAFNLLGGVAFYAQKGWVFAYDSTQDYYKGCIVIDPADGNKYECIADMTAGTIAPHSDSSNTHWQDANFLIKQLTPAFNTRAEITTSGTWTAPANGWYKITAKGGGGGGQGGRRHSTTAQIAGAGGGEGGTTIEYKYITAGSVCSITIGAGGSGGAGSTSGTAGTGTDGGDTIVTVGGNTYTAHGGKAGGGLGGEGTIHGNPGGQRTAWVGTYSNMTCVGGPGGGNGGGITFASSAGIAGNKGGGGGGGAISTSGTAYAGGPGGNGYVWFEYWAD